jgi:hypothetical protein
VKHPFNLQPGRPTCERNGLAHLVVVAGPSGSGKSTFVGQLTAGTLPIWLMDLLPEGATNWRCLKRAGHRDWLPRISEQARRGEIAGVILDFDMATSYEDNPVLTLLRTAKRVTVITLRPAADELIRQLSHRESAPTGGKADRRSAPLRVLIDTIGNLLLWPVAITTAKALPQHWSRQATKMIERVRVPNSVKRQQRLARKISRYHQDGWLDALYQRWDSYLVNLTSSGVEINRIFLAPRGALQPGEKPDWRSNGR